jgi:hypothetical protein
VSLTDEQVIAALEQHGSINKAAVALGLARSTMQKYAKRLPLKGYSPQHGMTHTVPEGFQVKGVSTLYDREGKIAGQWVKSAADAEARRKIMEAVVASLVQEVSGLARPIKAPKRLLLADSLSSYMIGDAHFGAYAWAAETGGEDFDTSIASADLRAAIDLLVAGAPDSETGYLVDVGDYLHADNRSNMTPASGHLLDVDTRYQRVIRVAVDAMRYCIGRMLQKHRKVKVFITPGNHNPDSAGWMAMVIAAYYANEPRVEVETSPAKFFYQRFGRNLIGITHGDKIKLEELPSIMAHDRAEDWGQTEHRYWWTGHIHHTKHQEYRGCTVEAFNTLAAGDAWHAASGYRAKRQMQRIDIDRTHGIYSRAIASVGMIRARAA